MKFVIENTRPASLGGLGGVELPQKSLRHPSPKIYNSKKITATPKVFSSYGPENKPFFITK